MKKMPKSMEATENKFVGGFEVKKVVREFVDFKQSPDGESFGNHLDYLMRETAKQGGEIQSVTVHVTEEYWEQFSKNVMEEENRYNNTGGYCA
jgi:hypothetical protein